MNGRGCHCSDEEQENEKHYVVEASEASTIPTGNPCESEGYGKRAVQLYMSTAGVSRQSLKMIYNSAIPAFSYLHTPHNPHI